MTNIGRGNRCNKRCGIPGVTVVDSFDPVADSALASICAKPSCCPASMRWQRASNHGLGGRLAPFFSGDGRRKDQTVCRKHSALTLDGKHDRALDSMNYQLSPLSQ